MEVLLTLLGAGPRRSRVRVDETVVTVHMGIGFRCTIPRPNITRASPEKRRTISIGVHGWRGRWLVNGSLRGFVTIAVDPPVRGRVYGVPVRVRELTVGVDDPAGLLAAIGG